MTAIQGPMFGADCQRCGQCKVTFDIMAASEIEEFLNFNQYECMLRCRKCGKSKLAILRERSNYNTVHPPMNYGGKHVDPVYELVDWVFQVPNSRATPLYVPQDISQVFQQGAACLSLGLWDAAGAMFRKVLDASTRISTPLPDSNSETKPPSWKVYKDLRLRLDWLFENNMLDKGLSEFANCIHQDGNDAVHSLVGIGQNEAIDLADFSESILEFIYTRPGKIAENHRRREERRKI